MELWKRFFSYYRKYRKLLVLDLIAATLISILDLIFPQITKYFINDLIPNQQETLLIRYTILFIFLYAIKMVCYFVMAYWGHMMGTRMETDMRSDLFRHLQTLSFEYYDENKTGQIMSRLVGDLREIGELAHHGPEDLFISLLMIVGSFFLMFQISNKLTLITFIFVIILIVFSVTKRKKMMLSFRAVRKNHAEINAKIESSISGIRLCKSFANEDFEVQEFEINNGLYRDSWKDAYKNMGIYSAGNNFFLDVVSVVAVCLGGIYVFKENLAYGDLVAFILYSTIFVQPVRRLIQFTQQFESGNAGFERFHEIMQLEPNIKDSPSAYPLTDPIGDIEFNHVDFYYTNVPDPILKDFTLHIPLGKTIALVGPSGVGKTTISHLIPRFYEIAGGEILINHQDIRKLTQRSLRANIGFVQQDVFVFFGTIAENIRYGKPEATPEEVIAAATKAHIHDFIMSLPEGYDSLVGERGVKLSGGQKQRIAIARVFLKNPPILILDEATSSLDNTTEQLIQKSIFELAKNRTTLIIAHRLSTIKNADEILVLVDEGIIERGTHQELLDHNGLYAELYHAQFKGFLPDSISERYFNR